MRPRMTGLRDGRWVRPNHNHARDPTAPILNCQFQVSMLGERIAVQVCGECLYDPDGQRVGK